MHLKDYYNILQLEPSASQQEIKKAFRILAQQYHPDKNQHDPYTSAHFTEIKEAYEVLTNPAKKEYYLQQRWYNHSIGKRNWQGVVTPVFVLKQVLELEKYVSTLDAFRMDKEGLKQYVLGLLTDGTIEQLKKFNDVDTNGQIISTILRAIHPLSKQLVNDIIPQLYKIAEGNDIAGQQLSTFIQKIERNNQREKYSLVIIIIATVILCLLIYLAGH